MTVRMVLLGLMVLAATAQAAIYYVSPGGDDGAPGTEDRPWATVQHAAETAVAGDTVVLAEGAYPEVVTVRNSGEPGRPITFRGEPAREAVIDASEHSDFYGIFEVRGKSHVVIEGLTVRGGLRGACGIVAFEADHVTIRNCHTLNTRGSGIMVWQSSDVVVDGNEVERACQRGGEESVTVKFGSERVQVRNNHIHHTGHEGVDVKEGSRSVRVFGNHIHHVQRQGLYVDSWNRDTGDVEFFNNVVHDCGFGMGACAETGGLLRDVKFYNNIVYNCPGPGMFVADWGRRRSAHPIDGVAFVNNTMHNCGSRWGGGMLLENAEAENVLVRNNIFSLCGPPAILNRKAPISVAVTHNLFFGEGQATGDSPVIGDPLFVDAEEGDFHLRPGSPAVDAGWPEGAPAFDCDGQPRPAGSGIDIGTDERSTEEPVPIPEPGEDR